MDILKQKGIESRIDFFPFISRNDICTCTYFNLHHRYYITHLQRTVLKLLPYQGTIIRQPNLLFTIES